MHIFQDVYEWAGQERTAPVGQFMTKGGRAYYGAGTALCARGCSGTGKRRSPRAPPLSVRGDSERQINGP